MIAWLKSDYAKTLGLSIIFGMLFWIVDGYFEHAFFHKNLKFMLLEGPETLTESLFTKVPMHSLFVRISFIFAACIGGILLSLFLYRKNLIQKDLRQSEETFSGFFNQGNIGMAITSLEKGWLNVNKKLCKMLGYSKKEMLKKTWAEMTYPDDLEADLTLFKKMVSGEIENYEIEKHFIGKDKSVICTHLTVSCIRYADGSVDKVLVTLQDITERELAEKRITHLNKVLRAIRDVNQLIVREKDPDALIREGCKLLMDNRGYNSALIVLTDENDRPISLVSSGRASFFESLNTMLERHELPPCCSAQFNREVVLIDDRHGVCGRCPVAEGCAGTSSLFVRLIHEGAALGYLIVALDHDLSVDGEEIDLFSEMAGDLAYALNFFRMEEAHESSERKRESLEDQLIQAQKMESVGRLAGGVAHDYNNISSIIIGYSELALEKVEQSDPLHDDLLEISTAARRSTDITRQLLAFARQQTIAPKVLNLNDTIESMLKMLRRLIGEDINLAWLPGAETWPVRMDPTQVDQILANLCVNARDSIADVGNVTIETKNISFDEDYCDDHPGFFPGEYVLLAVSDDGSGMAPEILDKIFEPFFTTKGLGKGTGLGLATVYGIVKQNNGFINVYSEPKKGTTIKIYLSRHAGQVFEAHRENNLEIPLSQGETVLLVEDDGSILKLGKRILEDLGYDVLSATSPIKAAMLAEEHAGEISLLITDVVMPEMNGRELSNQLQSRYPDLKTLFMSGYTANVIAHRGVLEDGVCFIPKPFSKKDMAVKVREVLDESKSSTHDSLSQD
jgi:two-component system, cell cycle sensor histidine kinase and response regulator CckA